MSEEVKAALESLREMQSNLEREVEWVLTEDLTIRGEHIHSHVSAIDVAISNLINYLESK